MFSTLRLTNLLPYYFLDHLSIPMYIDRICLRLEVPGAEVARASLFWTFLGFRTL